MSTPRKSTLGAPRNQGPSPFKGIVAGTAKAAEVAPVVEKPHRLPAALNHPVHGSTFVDKKPKSAASGNETKREKTPRKELKQLGTERAVMTRVEASEYLGISYATLWRMVREGQVPFVLVGKTARYRREDLDAYLDAQKSTKWAPTPGRSHRKG